jgi:hypothetical protein
MIDTDYAKWDEKSQPHAHQIRNRLVTEVCEGHAFLVKRRAENRERGHPRPQQRVLQKADAPTSLGNHTAHRSLAFHKAGGDARD